MYRQVNREDPRVEDAVVRRLSKSDAATLSDVLGRHGAMSARMRPLRDGYQLCGTALTVQCPAGDNLMVHKALQLARPGDVLVVDTGRTYDATVMGRNMSLYAERIGVAGIVIDGTVRDSAALKAMNFPVFSCGVVPRSAVKNGFGSVDVPVVCGDVVVQPGDVIVGDDDGVVVVPYAQAREVADLVEERLEMENQQEKDVQNSDIPLEILYGKSWINERLQQPLNEPYQVTGKIDPS